MDLKNVLVSGEIYFDLDDAVDDCLLEIAQYADQFEGDGEENYVFAMDYGRPGDIPKQINFDDIPFEDFVVFLNSASKWGGRTWIYTYRIANEPPCLNHVNRMWVPCWYLYGR